MKQFLRVKEHVRRNREVILRFVLAMVAMSLFTQCKTTRSSKSGSYTSVATSKIPTPTGHGMTKGEYPFDDKGYYRKDWAKAKPVSRTKSSYRGLRGASSKSSSSSSRSSSRSSKTSIGSKYASTSKSKSSTKLGSSKSASTPTRSTLKPSTTQSVAPTPQSHYAAAPPPINNYQAAAVQSSQRVSPPPPPQRTSSPPPPPPSSTVASKPAPKPVAKAAPAPAPAKKPSPAPAKYHKVVDGDTLYNISRRHGVTVDQLRSANAISGDLIRKGQSLRIP